MYRRNFIGFSSAAFASLAAAQDWPQWRGPNRDGRAPDAAGPANWPDKLNRVWKVSVGEGHSSPVVSAGRVFQFARTGEDESIQAFDLASGKKLFEQKYRAPYEMNPAATGHGKGPKSTPLVFDGKLYTFGMTGMLTCLNARTGERIWRFESEGKFRSSSPLFGVAMSPVVHAGRVIAHVGTDDNGAMTAFDANTGKVHWQWTGQGPAYSSPVLAGNRLITFSSEKLIGIDASNGALLWEMPFTTPYSQNAVTPFLHGDLLVYSGLSHPVSAIRLAGPKPQKVWENKEIGMYMSSPVLAAGLLHGLSHRNKGQFFSVEPATGRTVWTSDGRQTENAMLISRGDTVLSLTTEGELQVMRASGKGLQPLRKYTVADSPTWAHPVLLGSRVLVKDRDSLALWTA